VLADGSEYRGRYGLSVRELAAWHRPRLEALAEAGPDVLALETVPDIEGWDARRRAWMGQSRYSGGQLRQWIAAGATIAVGCSGAGTLRSR
jgi:S-methylmethionine-dependent homocysteine/selenocysteine methylase